jgi:branched-chain amino acid transport system substrate-binding protein
MADVAYNKEGWRKIIVLQEQTDYALGIYGAFSSNFAALGGLTTKEEFATSATDFRTQLTKIKGENPDALFIDAQTPASADRVLKQIQDLNWKPHIILSDVVPADVATMSQFKNLLSGAFAGEFGIDPSNAKFQHLSDVYKQKFNIDLPFASYGQTEYDAVYLVRDALAANGYNGTSIADWLRHVTNWDGASGKVTIGSDGDRVGGHKAETVFDGKLQPITQ